MSTAIHPAAWRQDEFRPAFMVFEKIMRLPPPFHAARVNNSRHTRRINFQNTINAGFASHHPSRHVVMRRNALANTYPALKRRAKLTAPLHGDQTMPFDSKRLQFAHTSLNLPKHGDFNAAFLTAQDLSRDETKSGNPAAPGAGNRGGFVLS
jgi:hypothetical protein